MLAPEPHQHGLESLFLFERRVVGDRLALDDGIAALPCTREGCDHVRHARRVVVEAARVEPRFSRGCAFEVNLQTRAVVLDLEDDLLALECRENVFGALYLVGVHELVRPKEGEPRALERLWALRGKRRDEPDRIAHRVEMLGLARIDGEGSGDRSRERARADAYTHLVQGHARKIFRPGGGRVCEDVPDELQTIFVLTGRAIRALPEFFDGERVGACAYAGRDHFAHIACVPDLRVDLRRVAPGDKSHGRAYNAGPDAELI